MPIRPEHRRLYPIDWRELSALIRFRRAGGACEHCGRPHGRIVRHLGNGRWYGKDRGCWRDDRGRRVRGAGRLGGRQLRLEALAGAAPMALTRVVLAGAHLDHDPGNNRPRSASAAIWRTTGASIGAAAAPHRSAGARWATCSSAPIVEPPHQGFPPCRRRRPVRPPPGTA